MYKINLKYFVKINVWEKLIKSYSWEMYLPNKRKKKCVYNIVIINYGLTLNYLNVLFS